MWFSQEKKWVAIFFNSSFCCAAPEIRTDFLYTVSDLMWDLSESYGRVQIDKCQTCVKMAMRSFLLSVLLINDAQHV